MAALERLKINPAGVRALLNDPGVKADLERRARAIAAQAGEGMEVSVQPGRNRARATVITATTEARVAEATNRSLSAAFDAGRA